MEITAKYIKVKLNNIYNSNEVNILIKIIFKNVLNLTDLDIILNKNKVLTSKEKRKIYRIVAKLSKNEPIQYILKNTEFYNIALKINKNVLIPRQETEELVDLIIKENKNTDKTLDIIDICTGSGCIAIAIAKNITSANIFATDISKKAINIGKANAKANEVKIKFAVEDILNHKENGQKYDIIVSNTPYILQKEKKFIKPNVLDYEPHIALFVGDSEPLIFYEAICKFAKNNLKDEGKLYLEINENQGDNVAALLLNSGFINIEIIKDLNNKNRIAKCVK